MLRPILFCVTICLFAYILTIPRQTDKLSLGKCRARFVFCTRTLLVDRPITDDERFDIDRRRPVVVGQPRLNRDDGIRVGTVSVLRAARQCTVGQ